MDTGIVEIHGKQYKTVALRVLEFREAHPDWCIETQLIENGERVVMRAVIGVPVGVPLGEPQKMAIIGSGFAEELRDSTNINKTSALENCETSAIGRALAACGYAGTEYASADEVANAISQQDVIKAAKWGHDLGQALLLHTDTIDVVKQGISEGHLDSAAEAFFELSHEQQQAIWIAPTKAKQMGIEPPFTTKEREIIKSDEFRKSHFNEDKS